MFGTITTDWLAMWIGMDGNINTAAAPDWADILRFVPESRIGQFPVSGDERDRLESGLAELEESTYEEVQARSITRSEEDEFVGKLPPPLEVSIAEGGPETLQSTLLATLEAQSWRWRLDYIEATFDCLQRND